MERLYNVPLRRQAMKSPIHSRAKRATKALREFIAKHMKSENVVLTAPVNERIWERGMKKPPHHIKIRATKDDDGKVLVELADGTVKEAPKAEKKPAKADSKPAKEAEKPKADTSKKSEAAAPTEQKPSDSKDEAPEDAKTENSEKAAPESDEKPETADADSDEKSDEKASK